MRFPIRARRLVTKSWLAARCYYRVRGTALLGRPEEEVWYFAYGANMHDETFRARRGIRPRECCRGRLSGYRLRFNLDGRPKGRAAPANLCVDPNAEVWGVLYRITRRDLMRLDLTEGVPGRGYRHVAVQVEGPCRQSRMWLGARKSTAGRRYATSGCCETAHALTGCPNITCGFWRRLSTRS